MDKEKAYNLAFNLIISVQWQKRIDDMVNPFIETSNEDKFVNDVKMTITKEYIDNILEKIKDDIIIEQEIRKTIKEIWK